jgi:hypothetical protein
MITGVVTGNPGLAFIVDIRDGIDDATMNTLC